MTVGPEIQALIAKGALFVANHSGGKDGQAMLIKLRQIIPAGQLITVHASLGRFEWEGALEHAEENSAAAGAPFLVARATKDFFDMVDRRYQTRPDVPSWPGQKHRQCTSDLKRGPIEREVRRYAKAHGFSIVVNCEGIRAEESADRARRSTFERIERNCTRSREWFDWLPVFTMLEPEVFATIAAAGQKPHWAYAKGNKRFSCVFCIFASKGDIQNGARHYPGLLNEYIDREDRYGYTMHVSRVPLRELAAGAA